MSRLHLTPPETIVPLNTATRLLRIAVTLRIVPVVAAAIILLIGLGTQLLNTILLVTWPSLALWVFIMWPGLEHRLGRYYLPLALGLTIVAQTLESAMTALILPPVRFVAGGESLRIGIPVEVRTVEPLFLLLVAVIIG